MIWQLLKNSLLVSGLTTLVAESLGFIAALWIMGLAPRRRPWALALAVIALVLPPFLVTNCWLDLLGPTGVWRAWLPFDILSLAGAVWILALLLWPIPLVATLSAWHQLEPAQLESDLAVTGWMLIRGLLLPVARNSLALSAFVVFVLSLNNFAVPAILQVKVFPAEMWVRFNTTFDTLGSLRLSWPLVLGPLCLLLLFRRHGAPWPHLEATVSHQLFHQQLGQVWFYPAGLLTLLLGSLSVGLPIIQICSVKRTWTELPGALAAGQGAIWNSFWFASVSAAAVIACGFGAAFWRVNTRRRSRSLSVLDTLVGWLAWVPFLLPGVFLGIGLIVLLNRSWLAAFYQSAGIVILALVVRYLAIGWNTGAHAVRTVDRDQIDAATLAGATRWQMLRYILWPQIAPKAAAAWYIVFLLCLWDAESMILVVPPGGETLALRVFNLLHYGHNAQVNALCLTLLAVAIAPLMAWRGSQLIRHWRLSRARLAGQSAILAATAGVLLTGCSPKTASNQVALQSRLFSSVQIIGSRGMGVGQFNKPRSVAVDAQGNLYAVDMTGRVQKFSSNGVYLLAWQMPQTELGKPKGMGHDQAGNVIVIEPHYQRVNSFSPEGKLVAQWGKRGTNTGEFMLPRAVAVNSGDEVLVSEYGVIERVQRFRPPRPSAGTNASNSIAPQLLASFGRPGNAAGDFNRPEGLCVDSQDRIYVADSCNHRIQVFSPDGKFIRAYGKPGTARGELSYPYDICVDKDGRQYVCEFGNSRIQVFDAHDQPIEIIGGPGAEPAKFNNPWGLALDSADNLYVADSQNHRVQKLIRR